MNHWSIWSQFTNEQCKTTQIFHIRTLKGAQGVFTMFRALYYTITMAKNVLWRGLSSCHISSCRAIALLKLLRFKHYMYQNTKFSLGLFTVYGFPKKESFQLSPLPQLIKYVDKILDSYVDILIWPSWISKMTPTEVQMVPTLYGHKLDYRSTLEQIPWMRLSCLRKISLSLLWPHGLYFRLNLSKRWNVLLSAWTSSKSTFKSYLTRIKSISQQLCQHHMSLG